jgi:flagellar motor switch protein FliG
MPVAGAQAQLSKTELDLSGIQRAAVVLVMLGDQASAEILKHLTEDEVQLVSREVARLKTVDAQIAEAVLEEFYTLTAARDYVIKGGLDYAKTMLQNAFGPETAKKLMDRLIRAMGSDAVTFDAIQKADPQQLAKFLHNEHPQTIALVLSHLNPSQAAALLASLPGTLRGDVSLRMASLDQISPDVINKIAAVIAQKLNALGEFSRESYGGVRAVAEMFNRLDSETSKEILNSIESEDAQLVETIRHLMFVFDDILLIDVNAIKEVLARVDRKVLTVALKGTGEQLKNHFLQCMSQRGAEMMREDMEALGPVKIKDVESAQQQVITVIRQLEAEGVLSLRGTVGEQYVV